MPLPLLITLQQQSQQFQTGSAYLIKLVEKLLLNTIIDNSTRTACEPDNTPTLPSLSPSKALLSQIQTLNDEQSQRFSDLQTVLNEFVLDLSKREYDITERELELSNAKISILEKQHEISTQLTKQEIEFAEKKAQLFEYEIKLKDELLSQKQIQLLNKEHGMEQKQYHFNPEIQFSNYSDQFTLVESINTFDVGKVKSPSNNALFPLVHYNNIKSLAICVNNYSDNKNVAIATSNSTLCGLVRTTIKKVQTHLKKLRIKQYKLRLDRYKLQEEEQKLKQDRIKVTKLEQLVVEREKVYNDWVGEPLKQIGNCLSHNMKTWEDAEAKRKKDEAGKDKSNQTTTKLVILWKIINLNKQISIYYDVFDRKVPLLGAFYKTELFLPLFEHFLGRDYNSGKIPKLTNSLKLYFSAPHVMNGKWIQFYGPGSFFDQNGSGSGHGDDILLSQFSLCDFNKKEPTQDTDDCDRCDLTPDECKKQHKSTDYNYDSYHAPATELNPNDFVVKIRWEE
jgi:hypothetical protein